MWLPETVTIYRGCNPYEMEVEEYGHSWTLDRGVAEKFAHVFLRHRHDENVVLTTQVSKNGIMMYDNGRNEQEVLVDANYLINPVTIVTGNDEVLTAENLSL